MDAYELSVCEARWIVRGLMDDYCILDFFHLFNELQNGTNDALVVILTKY